MNEIKKSINEYVERIHAEFISESMEKKDNIECCVCLEFDWGVKLPNCHHFICPICYYRMYYGYVDDNFCIQNEPVRPNVPINPEYPYKNIAKNLEIFTTLTNNDTFKEWFINENEDLYECIKQNEFVEELDISIKVFFTTDENIKKYENQLIQNKNELIKNKMIYKKYDKDYAYYRILLEKEKNKNIHKNCPLCRA